MFIKKVQVLITCNMSQFAIEDDYVFTDAGLVDIFRNIFALTSVVFKLVVVLVRFQAGQSHRYSL